MLTGITPSPAPTGIDPVLVTPGPGGFIVMFLVALAVIGLAFDLVRRVRRVRYRAELAERLDAEAALIGTENNPPSSDH